MAFVITRRIAKELVAHEGMVREAYKDSVGVWTWSVGITNSSGHAVHPKYLDKPQTLQHCLEIYQWLLIKKYLPAVGAVFQGFNLSEAQVGAALSFHYNTGGLRTASWPKLWKANRIAEARTSFMNWSKPAAIIPRRKKERDLFFDGIWSGDGSMTEYPVRKPSYAPNFSKGVKIDVGTILDDLFP